MVSVMEARSAMELVSGDTVKLMNEVSRKVAIGTMTARATSGGVGDERGGRLGGARIARRS